MTSLLGELFRIAREAAEVVLAVYESAFTVDYKSPGDPVTEADRQANELICNRLMATFPGVPIVAEESAPETFVAFRESPEVFFVDPVDGTREFVGRNGEFVVMIGLVEGHRATTAVIHAPTQNVAWGGRVGEGAWVIDAHGVSRAIRTSAGTELAKSRVVVSRNEAKSRIERVESALGTKDIVPLGSMGLKAARVAEGGADLYLAPGNAGKRWDSCAGDALVTAAGGCFTDMTGQPIDYRGPSLVNRNGIIACNAGLHEAIVAKLRTHLRRGV